MVWRWLVNALAVALATYLIDGIEVTGSSTGQMAFDLAVVAIVLGLVNTLVKPIVETLAGCLIALTLGLFMVVINALMLMLTSWVAGQISVGWQVEGFWPALWGSLIISLVSLVLGGLGARRQS